MVESAGSGLYLFDLGCPGKGRRLDVWDLVYYNKFCPVCDLENPEKTIGLMKELFKVKTIIPYTH
jgi:hypothetical protein